MFLFFFLKKNHAEYFKAALLIIKPLSQQTWGMNQHLLQVESKLQGGSA